MPRMCHCHREAPPPTVGLGVSVELPSAALVELPSDEGPTLVITSFEPQKAL